MRQLFTRGRLACLLVFAIILIDQIIKIEVKTNMHLHESIHITDWFQLVFIENNGMAYGMSFIYKPLLTILRVVASGFIGYYIWQQVKAKARWGYIVCLSMLLAGAMGNVFDCMFYGLIFHASSPDYVSYFVPFGQGYAPFLQGKVVDMFYFPLVTFTWPEWMPFCGGSEYTFFSPIFNFADSSITVSFFLLLLLYHKELSTISFTKNGMEHSTTGENAKPADTSTNAGTPAETTN